MDEFNGILDGDDVVLPMLVHVVDQSRKGCRLPRPGGAGHQHKAAVSEGQLFEDGRHAEVIERFDLGRDQPQDHGLAEALHEGIDAEPTDICQLERKVEVVGRLEARLLIVGEDIEEQGVHLVAA